MDRRSRSRGASRGIVCACALALGLLAFAGQAQAIVVSHGSHRYGITPLGGPGAAPRPAASSSAVGYDSTGQLTYHGGPVMHSVNSHVIYWDPNGEFTVEARGIVNAFLTDVAHDSGSPTNAFAVAGQYTDSTGHAAYSASVATPVVDGNAYPSSGGCTVPSEGDKGPPYTKCLTDAQVHAELSTYVSAHKLPTGVTQLYLVLLPHKVVSCFEATGGECSNNRFCAYHSYIGGGSTAKDIVYADIPWSLLDSGNAKGCQFDGHAEIQHPNGDTAGTNATTRYADVALKYLSHEYLEAATDPLLNAWTVGENIEIGDKCNAFAAKPDAEGGDPNAFLPVLGGGASSGTLYNQLINSDHYYIQSEWDNAAKACRLEPVALSGSVSASPEHPTAGSPVNLVANVTDLYGEPHYSWTFGDGSEATGPSVSHVYASPGNYTVRMTPVDPLTGATSAPVERTVTVTLTGEGGGTGESGTGGGGASGGSPATPAAPISEPAPLASSPTTPATTPAPDSSFTAVAASINLASGEITFSESVAGGGTFSWLLTFQNGKFGVFAASTPRCKPGFVRLRRKCRPSRIVFARGKRAVPGAGMVSFTVRPSAAGLKALRNAFRRRKGLPVTATLTFRSSAGGVPMSQTQRLTIRLKKL